MAGFTSRPDFGFWLAFNADPNDGATAPVWNDRTQYVRSMSGLSRGIQYELGTSMSAQPSVIMRDLDEALNQANASSPFFPNVVPYRRALLQGTWPNGTSGNLLNTGAWRGNNQAPVDPTFDSYTAGGAVPWWIGRTNSATTTISAVTPRSGANCVLASWSATTGGQGCDFRVRTMPGRQYTMSAYVRLNSANTALISVIGGASGTTTTTVGSYVRLSVTFTATQPQTLIAVASTGATAAGSLCVDDVQLEQGASVSAFTTTGPVIYPIMAPYAERFTKVFRDGGFTGYVNVPCVDALTALSGTSIATDLNSATAIQYTPDHWWTMAGGDQTSAYLPAPASSKSTPSLRNLVSKNGLGNGLYPAPGSPSNIPGDAGGTGVVFTPPTPPLLITTTAKGAIIQTAAPLAFPAVAGTAGYTATIAAWVTCTIPATVPLENPGIVCPVPASATTTRPPWLQINSTDGTILAQVGGSFDGSLSPLVLTSAGPVVTDGQPHWLVMVVTQDATNTLLQCFVDGLGIGGGVITGTASIGGVLTAATTGRAVQIGGQFAFGSFQNHITGQIEQVMLWDRALLGGEIFDLWHAGIGYEGLITSGQRVAQHIQTYGRYGGATRISPGTTVMGPPSFSGTIDLLTDTNNTVDAELGRVWAAPDGAVVFEGRDDRFQRLTSLYTLGQNVAGGHIPYLEDVEFDTDPQYIYVNVRYTQSNGPTGIGGTPADILAAGVRFFYPSFSKSVDVSTADIAQTLADWVFYTHNGAVQRVAAITLDPASNPALWPFCLSVELGQRLTVSMKAPAANGGAGLTWTGDFFVESVTHDGIDMDNWAWFTTLWMSPIALGTPQSAQPWILENASYGVLDSTTRLAP